GSIPPRPRPSSRRSWCSTRSTTPDPEDHRRLGARGAHLPAGVHLGRGATRRATRSRPDPGLRLHRAVRGSEAEVSEGDDAMAASTRAGIARSDVVGSLLRPAYLREAREAARAGTLDEKGLRIVEDRAVREAIAMQESAGLDVITDGELRRNSWVVTIPLREIGIAHAPLAGYEFLPAEPG